jgi:hypothetical protein
MKGEISQNIKAYLESLERYIPYHNEERYFTEHTGIRPIDILNGKIPDKYLFKEQIERARKDRIKNNQQFNACIPKNLRCFKSKL